MYVHTAPQSLIGRASTPKSRPKTCRAEQRKTIHHHATQPKKLVERSPVFPNANRASQTVTEASTANTSPFKPNGEATLQETSLPPRRKCVNSSKATRVLTQNMYPLLYQALHPRRKSSPEESNFRTISNTQTPRTRTARYKDNGNNAPDSKCELREHIGQEILSKAYVG